MIQKRWENAGSRMRLQFDYEFFTMGFFLWIIREFLKSVSIEDMLSSELKKNLKHPVLEPQIKSKMF